MLKHSAALLLLFTVLFSFQCRKPKSELEQLPAASQTGAETFGCLVNGKAFKPKGSPFGGPILSCAYQYLHGGYHLQLKALNKGGSTNYGVGIFTDSLKIQNGVSYTLATEDRKEGASGLYTISTIERLIDYTTNNINTGKLTITHFDEVRRIVSGTFWFDAVNSNGEKVEVREGRFDLHFTL